MKPTHSSMNTSFALIPSKARLAHLLGLPLTAAQSDESTISPDGSDPLASPVCSDSERSPRSFCSAIQIGCFTHNVPCEPLISGLNSGESSSTLNLPKDSVTLKRPNLAPSLSPLLTPADLKQHTPIRSITPKATQTQPTLYLPRARKLNQPAPKLYVPRKRDTPSSQIFPSLTIDIPAIEFGDTPLLAQDDFIGRHRVWNEQPSISSQIIEKASFALLNRTELTSDLNRTNDTFWRGRFSSACLKKGPFRRSMEDRFTASELLTCNGHKIAIYAIFDGHSGTEAAEFLTAILSQYIEQDLPALLESPSERIQQVIELLNEAFFNATTNYPGVMSGSTIVLALLIDLEAYLINLGDSGVMVVQKKENVLFQAEHTCGSEEERRRIQKLGGVLFKRGTDKWRLQGELALSRAFGNRKHKQYLSTEITSKLVRITEKHESLLLGSDGLWNSFREERRPGLDRFLKRSRDSEGLVELAMKSDVRDNMSAISVDLQKWRQYVLEQRRGSMLNARKSSSRVAMEPQVVLKRHAHLSNMNFEFPEV